MTQALPQKRRLGRGLAALIGDDASEESVLHDARSLRHMPIELLHASPNNPRKAFKDEELEDLARSIKTKGLLAAARRAPAQGRRLRDRRGRTALARRATRRRA